MREPYDVVHSAVASDEVMFCLQNKIQAPVSDLNGAKVIASRNSVGAIAMLYTVKPEGTGSVIEMRRGDVLGFAAFRKCYQPQ